MRRRVKFVKFMPWKVLYYLTEGKKRFLVETQCKRIDKALAIKTGTIWLRKVSGIGGRFDEVMGYATAPIRSAGSRRPLSISDPAVARVALELASVPCKTEGDRQKLVVGVIRCVWGYFGFGAENSDGKFDRLIREALELPEADRVGFLIARQYWTHMCEKPTVDRHVSRVQSVVDEYGDNFPIEIFGALIAAN